MIGAGLAAIELAPRSLCAVTEMLENDYLRLHVDRGSALIISVIILVRSVPSTA